MYIKAFFFEIMSHFSACSNIICFSYTAYIENILLHYALEIYLVSSQGIHVFQYSRTLELIVMCYITFVVLSG